MRHLTEFQKEFLLRFFPVLTNCSYGRLIANDLIEFGTAVAPSKELIWVGGIGNFLTTSEDENFHNCLRYKFDLESFMKSEYYKQYWNEHLSELRIERDTLIRQIIEIGSLEEL